MSRKPLIALYSAAHFWVDLSCAFLMFRTLSAPTDAFFAGALFFLLYNFCAFALQMPLGLLADRLDRNGVTAAAGCILAALAYFLPPSLPTAVVLGMGNALFHLGGGIDTLNAGQNKAAALSVFVSPGAVGLWLGAVWGKGSGLPLWTGALGLVVLAAAILLLCRKTFGSLRSGNTPFSPCTRAVLQSGNAKSDPAGQFLHMLLLFLVVVLRSYMGMGQSFPWKGTGLVLTLALALGKAGGGLLMDRLGPWRSSLLSLGLAAGLYLLSALPLPGILAVFFFNMTMPVTLWAAARLMPGAKGFTFGLLTFALFLGYLPAWMGWPSLLNGPWSYAVTALISLVLLWLPLRKEAVPC